MKLTKLEDRVRVEIGGQLFTEYIYADGASRPYCYPILAPDGTPLHVTASFGVASFPNDAQDMNTLIQMADKALYKSKDAGRDRGKGDALPGVLATTGRPSAKEWLSRAFSHRMGV